MSGEGSPSAWRKSVFTQECGGGGRRARTGCRRSPTVRVHDGGEFWAYASVTPARSEGRGGHRSTRRGCDSKRRVAFQNDTGKMAGVGWA